MITDLLERASGHVPAPAFAEVAWAKADNVRRRRRSVVAAVSVVAVLSVTIGALHILRPEPNIGVTGEGEALSVPTVDRMPEHLDRRTVRSLPSDGLLSRVDDVRPLSERPVTRAVAVFEPYGAEAATSPEPLYVLDTDGTWARVDGVDLAFTRDAGGNTADPLRPTAISPDGRLVAVPQPGEVLVIDVTTAAVHHVPLPGYNEQVAWRSNDVLLVTGDTATYAVDWRAASFRPVGAGLSAWNIVMTPPGGPVLELRGLAGAESGNEPITVTEWDLDNPVPLRRTTVVTSLLGAYRMNEWYGPALGNGGDLIVRSGWGSTPTVDGGELVAVVDARTGVVLRMLDMGRDRWKGCCQPLAWVDEYTVLLRTEKEGLITWHLPTGTVSIVAAGVVNGTVALNLPGQR